jgi:DNA-binding beta-propeller fold protein YncE
VKVLSRLVPAAAAAMAVAAFAAPAASASTERHHPSPGADNAVFVQTDNLKGNAVVAYSSARNGTLTLAAAYPTGGVGGQLTGSVVDHLASQGSLTYDRDHGLLYAVNAGSNTVSVFAVFGDHLALRQVIGSGGPFPVSVTVHGDLVYVLNALNGGSVYGYRVDGGQLSPIPGSLRVLGLNPSATPQFTNTPGQVAFTPDGSALIVTTKANGNDVDVFAVGQDGRLSSSPAVNSEPGACRSRSASTGTATC